MTRDGARSATPPKEGVIALHATPTVDLDRIGRRLFEHPVASRRIRKDYGIEFGTPSEMAAAMLRAFGQSPTEGDLSRSVTAGEVFRAAVLALASNSRTWSSFVGREPRLRSLLEGYDPCACAASLAAGRVDVDALRACLPGQTGSADAKAMLRWSRILGPDVRYYAALAGVRDALLFEGASRDEVVPMVAALLGGASPAMERRHPPPKGLDTWKAPGMGPVLASEFLRGLRWSGFKPDRHIKRLLGRWFPDVVAATVPRAQSLASRLGTRAKDVVEFLTFSLVGMSVTPAGKSYTEADALIWALGAYLEKAGKESATIYRLG